MGVGTSSLFAVAVQSSVAVQQVQTDTGAVRKKTKLYTDWKNTRPINRVCLRFGAGYLDLQICRIETDEDKIGYGYGVWIWGSVTSSYD